MVPKTVPAYMADTIKLVKDWMMHTVVSGEISRRACGKEFRLTQSMSLAVPMASQDALFIVVRLRQTLASPIMVKSWATGMMRDELGTCDLVRRFIKPLAYSTTKQAQVSPGKHF